jgi:hypothetical protein
MRIYVKDGQGTKRAAYSQYRRNATERFLPFTLTFEEFLKLTAFPCYYCGRPPSNLMRSTHKSGSDFIYQGIDREDNNQGYTRSNSVPCCHVCNKAKGVMSHIEFLAFITKVYKYSIEAQLKRGL